MKRKLKKILLGFAVFVAAVAAIGAALGFYVWAQFGSPPSADEVARFSKLPYYQDGRFISPEPMQSFPDRVTGAGAKGWIRFLLPNSNAPTKPLPQALLTADSFAKTPADLAAYWLGHSSLIIELEGKRFLVDPVFGNAAPLPFAVRRFVPAPIELDELPPIDVVLITHDHYDHLERATIGFLRHRNTRFVVPYGVGAHLIKWGVERERITEIGWGESVDFDGVAVAAERTIHYSGRSFDRQGTTLWTSYALKGQSHRIFISGDSGYGEHFKEIGAKHGAFDLAFIEIDGWNDGWPKTHMFPHEAIAASHDVGAKAVIPVHWGVFDLARHKWDESIEIVANLAAEDGNITLLTPLMGEKIEENTKTHRWWRGVE